MFSKPYLLCVVPVLLLSACDEQEAPSAASSATSSAAPLDSAAVMEKTLAGAEAKAHLIGITRGVMAAALKEPAASDTLPTDDDQGSSKKLPDNAKPVPANADDVKGKAYTSTPADWEAWAPIGFRLSSPQKCQYEWTREEDTRGYASAKCDFDGDGKLDLHAKQRVIILDGVPKVGVLEEVVPLQK
ncbi:MAG: hypothetical protein H6718_18090 [Polyangiaceae bacterium]|nr:hypothetical protein [Polyangiaceae bacterium]MCB9605888.1 hypothetical protein [Polyangiaceae bacterium]